MRGSWYAQLTKDGSKIKNPIPNKGYIDVKNKKLNCFDHNDYFLLEMDVLDFTISADGILFKGIEDNNGRKQYNEIWFTTSSFYKENK